MAFDPNNPGVPSVGGSVPTNDGSGPTQYATQVNDLSGYSGQVKINTTRDHARNQGVKCITYGNAGMGKTVLGATAPRPIFFSAEKGLLSISRMDLPYIQIDTYDDLLNAYKWALESNERRQFDTLCLDSITEIAEICLASQGSKDGRKNYGDMAQAVVDVFRKFRDLPQCHVYMTAQMARAKDEGTGMMLWGPSFPGTKLDQKSPYLVDEVWQLTIGQDNNGNPARVLRTQPDNQFQAKDRSGALAPWEPANLDYIFSKIMNG